LIHDGASFHERKIRAVLRQVYRAIEILWDKGSGSPEREKSKIPVIDPAIPFHDSIYDEAASTLLMAGHASVVLDKEIDVGFTELWIVIRKGYGFVTFFTF
jgi:hypothetical protein